MDEEKTLAEFMEDLIEGELEISNSMKDVDDVYDFALNNGYVFEKEELEDNEILDDIFDCVAGGRKTNAYNENLGKQ